MDALVVGCGLTGAVVARFLAERLNKKVIIWDRRFHIGGNMYDYRDEHNILIHKYGPHTFHTTKKYLFDFMCKYSKWVPYKLTCMAKINGKFTPTPFNYQTIDDYYSKGEAEDLKRRIKRIFGDRKKATVVEVLNCTDEKVRAYAKFLFDNDYSLYTAKQWGVSASEIDPSVLKRVPLRFSYEVGYFDDEYQVMPETSYTDFFKNLLDHPNVEIELGIEALDRLAINNDKLYIDGIEARIPVVFTGALDELFGLSEGRLPYRSLRFEWKYEDIENKQDAPVVAYPQEEGYTRITEYKKLPIQNVKGTTYAVEYPLQYDKKVSMEPYYPVLTEESQTIHAKYILMAKRIRNLYYAGRLADFKYYNMDQTLERSLNLCNKLLFLYGSCN